MQAEYRPSGGEGGIRTHGGLAPTAVFKTAALNHSATSPNLVLLSLAAPSRASGGLNQAGLKAVLALSLGCSEEGVLAVSGWILVGGLAVSIGSAAAPVPQKPQPVQL